MAWLLDTNAWIYHLKNPGSPIEQRLAVLPVEQIMLCYVVKAELWHGAQKYGCPERRLEALESIFDQFVSLPFDDAAAWEYARIRHELELRGQLIGPNDLKIAAICAAHALILAPSDVAEFRRVSGLRVEDWTQPVPE